MVSSATWSLSSCSRLTPLGQHSYSNHIQIHIHIDEQVYCTCAVVRGAERADLEEAVEERAERASGWRGHVHVEEVVREARAEQRRLLAALERRAVRRVARGGHHVALGDCAPLVLAGRQRADDAVLVEHLPQELQPPQRTRHSVQYSICTLRSFHSGCCSIIVHCTVLCRKKRRAERTSQLRCTRLSSRGARFRSSMKNTSRLPSFAPYVKPAQCEASTSHLYSPLMRFSEVK